MASIVHSQSREAHEVSRAELWIAVVGLWSTLLVLLVLFAYQTEIRVEDQPVVPVSHRA